MSDEQKPLDDAISIARKLKRVVAGRAKEIIDDKRQELGESLRSLRSELDEEIEGLKKER